MASYSPKLHVKHSGKARKAAFKLLLFSSVAVVAIWAIGAFTAAIVAVITAIAVAVTPFLIILWLLFALFTLKPDRLAFAESLTLWHARPLLNVDS